MRHALPSLSVIVPARNEEADITATLMSLLATEGVNLQVIAINDRSTDQTGSRMQAVAGVEVLQVTELPSGWLGKTHAMHLAARRCHWRMAALYRRRRGLSLRTPYAAPLNSR